MPFIYFGGGLHAASYERLGGSVQDEVRTTFSDALNEVACELKSILPLPEYIELRFGSVLKLGKNNLATAYPGIVTICERVYLEYLDAEDAIRGLMAHEIGHLVDYNYGNDCVQPGYLETVVSEGKAEQLGEMYGGENYADLFCEKGFTTVAEIEDLLFEADERKNLVPTVKELNSHFYKTASGFVALAVDLNQSDILQSYNEPTSHFVETVEDFFEKDDSFEFS